MLDPFARDGPKRFRKKAGEADASVIGGNCAQLPLVVAGIRRQTNQPQQAMELRARDFVRLDSDEFTRRGGEFHLRIRDEERTAVGHKELAERRAREHEH